MPNRDQTGGLRPNLEFWFEFASTYSYLSVMRIGPLALDAGIDVIWRPFLLGPIFRDQGWRDSPFNIYPAKGRYMVRDMERLCEARGLAFKMPEKFPANGLLAARVALVGAAQGWIAEFSQAVFTLQFAKNGDISHDDTIKRVLDHLELPGDAIIPAALEPAIKQQLKTQTASAQKLGIFGAPTFVTSDGELFWGNDRLSAALDWAKTL